VNSRIEWFFQPISSLAIRLLIMGLGFCHVGLLMWDPAEYANMIGGFNLEKVLLLIWAMCSSMVVGVGFVPNKMVFRLLFNPYFSLVILLAFSAMILLTR